MILWATIKPDEEMPLWVLHCPEFKEECLVVSRKMGTFQIDTSVVHSRGVKICPHCGYIVPEIKGYLIVSGKFANTGIVCVDMIHIKEKQNEKAQTDT